MHRKLPEGNVKIKGTNDALEKKVVSRDLLQGRFSFLTKKQRARFTPEQVEKNRRSLKTL
jgi:hypothetical protein